MSNAHTTTDSILAARGGHTPGPWSWSELPCAGIEVRGPYKDGTRLLFSDIWRQFPEPLWDEEMRANARLIAAAPTMYDYVVSSASNGCHEAKKILEGIHASR